MHLLRSLLSSFARASKNYDKSITHSSRLERCWLTTSPYHQQIRCMSSSETKSAADAKLSEQISITFLKPDGKRITVEADQGKSLYDAVIDNNVDIDGFGACEGTLCCTTCHLIFKQSDYKKVGPPSDEELDMLDLAYGLSDTSRLGCQVMLRKDLDPLEVQVPASINDVRES